MALSICALSGRFAIKIRVVCGGVGGRKAPGVGGASQINSRRGASHATLQRRLFQITPAFVPLIESPTFLFA